MNETDPAHPATVQDDLAKAKKTFAGLGGVALLVGVESYLAYDSTGKKNLLSGRNDVLAYWKVCRRLGYKAEHIRVLTSPKLRVQDLLWAEQELAPDLGSDETEQQIEDRVKGWLSGEAPSVVLGEAKADEIRRGLEWLAEKLVFTVKLRSGNVKIEEEWDALPGIFAYSGHGTPLDGDLGLCPSDLGPGRENVLSFSELGTILDKGDDLPGGAHPTDDLTIVLDCCFAAASQPRSRALRVPSLAAGEPLTGKVLVSTREIGKRVLCASAREGQSYQAMLGGYWYGAFTWALTVALEQWKIEREGQWKRSTVSHGELLSRAKKLLSALSFQQEPILVDEEEIGSLPVFHHGPADGRETSKEPDVPRPGGQVDPTGEYGYYKILDVSDVLLAEIISVNVADTGDSGMRAETEYWRINGAELRSGNCAKITKEPCRWSERRPVFTAQGASFSTSTEWSTSAQLGSTTVFQQVDGDGGFHADLVFSFTENRWTGPFNWVRATGNTRPYLFTNVSSTGARLNAVSTPSGSTCYPVSSVTTISAPPASTSRRNVVGSASGSPIVHGDSYRLKLLHDTGACYLSSPRRDIKDPIRHRQYRGQARWSAAEGDALPHRFRRPRGGEIYTINAPEVRNGRTVYYTLHAGCVEPCSKRPRVYGGAGSTTSQPMWKLERVDPGDGPIRTGERIRIMGFGYLSAEKDGTLGRRPANDPGDSYGTIWVVLP